MDCGVRRDRHTGEHMGRGREPHWSQPQARWYPPPPQQWSPPPERVSRYPGGPPPFDTQLPEYGNRVSFSEDSGSRFEAFNCQVLQVSDAQAISLVSPDPTQYQNFVLVTLQPPQDEFADARCSFSDNGSSCNPWRDSPNMPRNFGPEEPFIQNQHYAIEVQQIASCFGNANQRMSHFMKNTNMDPPDQHFRNMNSYGTHFRNMDTPNTQFGSMSSPPVFGANRNFQDTQQENMQRNNQWTSFSNSSFDNANGYSQGSSGYDAFNGDIPPSNHMHVNPGQTNFRGNYHGGPIPRRVKKPKRPLTIKKHISTVTNTLVVPQAQSSNNHNSPKGTFPEGPEKKSPNVPAVQSQVQEGKNVPELPVSQIVNGNSSPKLSVSPIQAGAGSNATNVAVSRGPTDVLQVQDGNKDPEVSVSQDETRNNSASQTTATTQEHGSGVNSRKRQRSEQDEYLRTSASNTETNTQLFSFSSPQGPPAQRPKLESSLAQFSAMWFGEELPTNPGVPKMPEKLYHYTTWEGIMGILEDRYIGLKENSIQKFGFGIYFTEIPPERTTEEIVYNNFNTTKEIKYPKTEYCFEFLSADLPNLSFCEDQSWHYSYYKGRKDRDVWKSSVHRLYLNYTKGVYYRRELDGPRVPKFIEKFTWDLEPQVPL